MRSQPIRRDRVFVRANVFDRTKLIFRVYAQVRIGQPNTASTFCYFVDVRFTSTL